MWAKGCAAPPEFASVNPLGAHTNTTIWASRSTSPRATLSRQSSAYDSADDQRSWSVTPITSARFRPGRLRVLSDGVNAATSGGQIVEIGLVE